MANERPPVDLDRLEKAFRKLRWIEREVYLLSAADGLGYDEIAARLGISRENVKRQLVRALCNLDRILERPERPWWRFW